MVSEESRIRISQKGVGASREKAAAAPWWKMNKEEFIKLAVKSGYGNENAAKAYVNAHDKPEYTTNDFIALYHSGSGSMHWSKCKTGKGLRTIFGLNGKTTAISNGIAEEW